MAKDINAMKALYIKKDVIRLMESLTGKEAKTLISSLAAYQSGNELPHMSVPVKAIFNRIMLDNLRAKEEISEVRRKAANMRWHPEQTAAQERKKPPAAKCPLFEHEAVVTAWREWEEMRKKIGKPILSEGIRQIAIDKLMSLSGGNPYEAVKILRQSTDHFWIGFFVVNDRGGARGVDYDSFARDQFIKLVKGG